MISKKLESAINDQIQAEFYSAYLYLAMSNYCSGKNLNGFARWLKLQYQEETEHALKLVHYVLEREGKVVLKTIQAPAVDFGSPVSIFEKVLQHEKKVTALITKLYELAVKEKDYATQNFMQWYVNEQVEEEANASAVLAKLKMIDLKGAGLLFIDKELGSRSGE